MSIKYKKICDFLSKNNISITSDVDDAFEFNKLNSIERASSQDLIFFNNTKYKKIIIKTKAHACITKRDFINLLPKTCEPIMVDDPYLVFAILSQLFNSFPKSNGKKMKEISICNSSKIGTNVQINSFSTIKENTIIGDNVIIMENCVIGPNTIINDNSIIYNNCVIENSNIGKYCIIKHGAIIGGNGFGFHPNHKIDIYHSGKVIIENNVSIGSNTTIDRGSIENTIIKEYSRIDNLVQVAHNVVIGKHTIIAAQVGISGSSIIGNNVLIGGQAGIAGHIEIGNNVIIAAKSGVTKNISDNAKVAGFPAVDIIKWKKAIIKQNK